MSAPFSYDVVPYESKPNESAHPAPMALVARLFGIAAAAPSTARVLELGCGNGENLVSAASYLPHARFTGVDLAERAIALGQTTAEAAGITNVTLLHRDVRDLVAAPLGTFDYVIAHGLYSWVPEVVRADALKVMRAALEPHGVGFLSFNALPGWELSRALRELARHATRHIEGPDAKVEHALALIQTLAQAGQRQHDLFGALAAHAAVWLEHVEKALPPDAPFSWYVFHDLLAECNDPFSIPEMDRRLADAGLRRVAELPLFQARFEPDFGGAVATMDATGFPFAQLLVCRDDAHPSDAPRAEAAVAMIAQGEADATNVLAKWRAGEVRLAAEAPPIAASDAVGDQPRVPPHVRTKAARAVDANASGAILTSGLHGSYVVPWAELVVVRELDGATSRETIAARVAETLVGRQGLAAARVARHVDGVIAKLAGHGFMVKA